MTLHIYLEFLWEMLFRYRINYSTKKLLQTTHCTSFIFCTKFSLFSSKIRTDFIILGNSYTIHPFDSEKLSQQVNINRLPVAGTTANTFNF